MDMNQAERQYQKAIRLQGSGKVREAEIIYRKIIKAFPRLDSVWTNLGTVLYLQQRYEPALKALDRAISINPTNADAYSNRGASLMALGRPEQALEAYETLVGLQADNANNHYNYANLLYQLGRTKDSENAYEEAIRRNPDFSQAWFNLGFLCMQDQRLKEAESHFRRVIAIDPNYVAGYLNLGNLLTDSGEYDEASRMYRTALEIDPDFSMARANLARMLIFQSKPQEALRELEQVLMKHPDHLEALVNYGNALTDLGRAGEARAAYLRALELAPDYDVARQNLARLNEKSIPPWHFTMLADQQRNTAYRQAIEKACRDKVVLDIGTGSGLLAMMAARAGAQKIFGAEVVPEMAQIARQIIAQNGYAEQIHIFEAHSTTLQLGNEMEEPANVLVSEILDAGLTGEGVLDSHRHAIANLCTHDVQVIPARAELFAQLVAAPWRRQVTPIREIEGFDLSPMGQFQRMDKLQVLNLETEDVEVLTMVTPLWKVDFKELPLAAPAERPEVWETEFVAKKEGTAHALIFWFDLWLDDEIMVSSRPGGEVKHWNQAAWFFPEDLPLEMGATVPVKVMRTDMHWRFEIIPNLS